MRIRRAVEQAMVLGLLAAPPALIAAPQIKEIAPAGVRRGELAEVVFSGSALGGSPRLVAPFPVRVETIQGSDAASWKVRLTVDPAVAVGVYPVRIQTDDGVSNPFLLAVGQFPQVIEKEENSSFEQAQAIPEPPVIVEGKVPGNDVDFFRFRGRKGQRIGVDARCARIGSGIDPTLRLTTATPKRTYVASADDTPGLLTDARFTAILPEDSDYVVEISDTRYQGEGRPAYRLLIGDVPMAEEIYPLGGRSGETVGIELRGGTMPGVRVAAATIASPFGTDLFRPRITAGMAGSTSPALRDLDYESLPMLTVSGYPELREPADASAPPLLAAGPVGLNGRLDPAGDEDRFRVAVTPGTRVRFAVKAYELGSSLDAVLRVEQKTGGSIASADDQTFKLPPKNGMAQSLILPDPIIETTIPSGVTEVVVVIRDLEHRGGIGFPYRIVVEPLESDFNLSAGVTEVSVPRGGTAAVPISVKRNGYTGPIEVTIDGLPIGLSVRPGTIAAGQSAGVLTLSSSADAAFPATAMKLVGRGSGTSGTIERIASTAIVFARQSNLATNQVTEYGIVGAPAWPEPLRLDVGAAPIEVAHGFGATIPLKVTRDKGATGALAVSGLVLPAGVTIPGEKVDEKSEAVAVRVQSAVEAPLGTSTLALQAKGKVAGTDRTLVAPLVTIAIVRPASVELSAPAVEVKAGQTVEVKGRIVRKGTFNEPVTVRLNGLPAGLKADPVTLAAGAKDFGLRIVAEAKAAPASAGAQVVVAFQVNKKDYPVPPTPLSVKVLPKK